MNGSHAAGIKGTQIALLRAIARVPLALLLLFFLVLPLLGRAQLSYVIENGTATITKYTGAEGAVVIPDLIEGLPVTGIDPLAFCATGVSSVTIPSSVSSIGDGAFASCLNLGTITVDPLNGQYCSMDGVLFDRAQSRLIQCPGGRAGSYTIPEGVTHLGIAAFSWSSKLTNITIPNTVTNIGGWAFYGCMGLASVLIPGSVSNLGESAFAHCTNLAAISVEPTSLDYSSDDGVLFDKSQNLLIKYPEGKTGDFAIPGNVTRIKDFAFYDCTGLTGIMIPNSTTNLGGYAFNRCLNLARATIGNGVASIDRYAFNRCANLISVSVGSSVLNIGEYAFGDCIGLTSITIPTTVTNLENEAFQYCSNLTGVYFKGDAPRIDSSVFRSADRLTLYYLLGTTGWNAVFSEHPLQLWNPQPQAEDAAFGIRTNRFGFNIAGSSNLVLVVEACTNLANPNWAPVATNTLTAGSAYFSDPQWTNAPARFYRLRSP